MGILGDARRLRRNARRLSMGRTAFRIGLTGCIGPATMEIVLALPVRCVRAGWFYSRTDPAIADLQPGCQSRR